MLPDVIRFTKVLYPHSFKAYFLVLFDSYMNRPAVHVCNRLLAKIKQSAFTQASFISLFDVHESFKWFWLDLKDGQPAVNQHMVH